MMSLVDNEEIRVLLDGFDAMSVKLSRLGQRVSELEGTMLKYRDARFEDASKLTKSLPKSPNSMNPVTDDSSVSIGTAQSSHSFDDLKNGYDLDAKIAAGRCVRERLAPEASYDSLQGQKFGSLKSEQVVSGQSGATSLEDSASVHSAKFETRPERLEKDFTTPGEPGQLGCPYAKPSGSASNAVASYQESLHNVPRARADTRGTLDPMQADLHRDNSSSLPDSVAGSGPKCPIRFLDQHSPEEVAQYFEEHKHEIPRSHEICVKRYQTNSESIRQLDAKYGNLVSMIQGLGAKHQPMLPEGERQSAVLDEEEQLTDERVARWADSAEALEKTLPGGDEQEQRVSHFDRPLKEIRVGESPSRPWGISVPVHDDEDQLDAARGASAMEQDQPPLPARDLPEGTTDQKRPNKCPFGFDRQTPDPKAPAHEVPTGLPEDGRPTFVNAKPSRSERSKDPPQMVFTGPVFIGYSMEQAMTLLQRDAESRPNQPDPR